MIPDKSFDNLFQQLSDKASAEGKDLEEIVVANTKNYAKEVQQVINLFIQDYQLYRHGKISDDVYEEITEAKKRAVHNFSTAAAEDAINTVLRFLKKFIDWSLPIVGRVLEEWLKEKALEHKIKL